MKKSGKDRLKCVVCESTLSTAARSPFPNGEGYDTRMPLFSTQRLSLMGKAKRRRLRRKKEANPASRGHSLLPMEGGAPKGRRLDGESGIPDTKPSPRGKVASEASRIGY